MPRASGIKQLISPNRGLVTEQSKLSPMEGSTIDEMNFTFNDDCSIRIRRKGLNKEEGSSFFTLSEDLTDAVATAYGYWEAVGGDGDLNFHVFQIGATLFFIKDVSGGLAGEVQSFNFDLDTAIATAYVSTSDEPVDFATGDGDLYIVGKKIDPIFLVYDDTGPSVSSDAVNLMIRDLTGLDDDLYVSERPASLSESHQYNLMNQGWWQTRRIVAAGSFLDPITQFNTTNSVYPSNADIALLGMIDDGSGNLIYDPDYLLDLTLGNTPAAKGHFIIDPFNITYDDFRTGTADGSGGYGTAGGSAGGANTSNNVLDPNWWNSNYFWELQ